MGKKNRMIDEDEDVLFDQAGMSDSRLKLSPGAKNRRLSKTVCLFFAFLGLGLVYALPGPTLIDLKTSTGTTTEKITTIFTSRSVGYFVGSVIGGCLFDTLNQPCLLSTSLFATASATAVMPHCNVLSSLLFVTSLQGISMGFLDTGGNVLCIQLWGRDSGTPLQAMHFAYAVGAFVAPLVAEPFLGDLGLDEKLDNTTTTTTTTTTPSTTTTVAAISTKSTTPGTPPVATTPTTTTTTTTTAATTTESPKRKKRDNDKQDNDKHDKQVVVNKTETGKTDVARPETNSRITIAYMIVAALVGLVAVSFVYISCQGPCSWKAIPVDPVPDNVFFIRKETFGFRIKILVLLFFFYFVYVGLEITYGGLILTLAVDYLSWKKRDAANLTSLFWGSFAFGRLSAMFVIKFLSPHMMLIVDLLLSILAAGGLSFGVDQHSYVIWICTAVLGLGMASIFPTGIAWAEKYMAVTGKATAVFVVGSALGEMVFPFVTGVLYEQQSPKWLFYIVLAGISASIVIFIIMQQLASRVGERYQRLPQASVDGADSDSDLYTQANSPASVRSGKSSQRSSEEGWKKRVSFQLDNLKDKVTPKPAMKYD